MEHIQEYDLYRDIQTRCNGEIYIGVVGPVRTGKSTFIKRFMDVLVLPSMEDEYEKERAVDEMPQSAMGRTITTTEPKFIPKNAATLSLSEGVEAKVRLIDCVGFMVEGASGHMEDGKERMVKTPWSDDPIPFTKAAEIGTEKVISDHSSVGIVVTTDGSFTEIDRESYVPAEEKTISELKKMKKPFVVLMNTTRPYSEEALQLCLSLKEKYQVGVLPVNLAQLRAEDTDKILEMLLCEFPVTALEFYMPAWVQMLPREHPMKQELIVKTKVVMNQYQSIRDVIENPKVMESAYLKNCKMDSVGMADGCMKLFLEVDQAYYYEMLSALMGEPIQSEYQLMNLLKNLAKMKQEYGRVLYAMDSVRQKGYGVVSPYREEIVLDQPELIKHGNKFGVKIKAVSPSIHMIKANIETEISPIVGSEEQAKDLIRYISDSETCDQGIWETNIFGKTVEQLVKDGIDGKLSLIGEESQGKLQETMQKIVNESNGGMVCIII